MTPTSAIHPKAKLLPASAWPPIGRPNPAPSQSPTGTRSSAGGTLAEFAARNLTKGRRVFVAGRLTYQSWEGRDGHKRRTAEIVAGEIIPCDRRRDPDNVPDQAEPDDV